MKFNLIIITTLFFGLNFIDEKYSDRNQAIIDSAVEISKSSFLRGCTEAGETLSWCLIKMNRTEKDTRELLNSEIIREPASLKQNKESKSDTDKHYSDPYGKQKKV